jgi:hypothetical protein
MEYESQTSPEGYFLFFFFSLFVQVFLKNEFSPQSCNKKKPKKMYLSVHKLGFLSNLHKFTLIGLLDS